MGHLEDHYIYKKIKNTTQKEVQHNQNGMYIRKIKNKDNKNKKIRRIKRQTKINCLKSRRLRFLDDFEIKKKKNNSNMAKEGYKLNYLCPLQKKKKV